MEKELEVVLKRFQHKSEYLRNLYETSVVGQGVIAGWIDSMDYMKDCDSKDNLRKVCLEHIERVESMIENQAAALRAVTR